MTRRPSHPPHPPPGAAAPAELAALEDPACTLDLAAAVVRHPAIADGRAGFEALFAAEYEPMVRLAYLMLGARAEAEDVVQDAYARLDLRWSRVANPGAYLRRCVVNGATDVLRRRKVERRLASLARRDAEQAAAGDLGADEMSDALAALTPRRRAAVVLRYYAGLREEEIAEALGVRPGTVKSTLHRALAQLREVVER